MAEINNCVFLYIGGGICPYHTKSCKKPCENYSVIGDALKPIFHDWNNGIDKLAEELKQKYFRTGDK